MFDAMKRQATITTLLFVLLSSVSFAQTSYLFVKKGIKKKRIYTEGDIIHVQLKDGKQEYGYLTLLRNDSLFINGKPYQKSAIRAVLLKRKPKRPFPDGKTLALIAAGSAMTSLGLSLNNHTNRDEALIAGPVIGFGPLLLKHFGGRAIRAIPRKKFRIGRKFYLQVLDFHLPQPPVRLKTF